MAQDVILDAMKAEIDRSFAVLKEQTVSAYYISYRVHDKENNTIIARFGNLQSNNYRREGYHNVIVRVGSNEMDNTRVTAGNGLFLGTTGFGLAPFENQAFALKMKLWETTGEAYKRAVEEYGRIKASVGINAETSDYSGDFTCEIPEQYYEAPISLKFNAQVWEEKLRMYSLVFDANKDLVDGYATLDIELLRKYFVDTDGAIIAQNNIAYRLSLTVRTIADDGMDLPLYQSYFAMNQDGLPSDAIVIADAQRISKLATQLKNAPVADSYSGPAIISPKTSAVFFHEIFGHHIEGSRLKYGTDAQTFKNKVGEVLLPDDISVVFDPRLKEYMDVQLSGSYVFDDEGVRGQRVVVIENGILKSFLMSRTPIDGFPKSNGHGRGDIGILYRNPESRQSNMIVKSTRPRTDEELRKMLIDEINRTGKEYGYLFDEVIGGFTNTGRIVPNAFNVTPLVVYRIYADGRPDELVRGINLIGTPLTMFSQIAACSDRYDVFNGYCVAPSGPLPVSCVAPSLFVKMIETQRKPVSTSSPPILVRP